MRAKEGLGPIESDCTMRNQFFTIKDGVIYYFVPLHYDMEKGQCYEVQVSGKEHERFYSRVSGKSAAFMAYFGKDGNV